MPPSFDVQVVSADRQVYQGRAVSVVMPGADGYLGVLHGHAPLYAALAVGCVTITPESGGPFCIAISGGFAEVMPDHVLMLADTAERAEEIDVERARQARERAEERLRARADKDSKTPIPSGYSESSETNIDVDRARAALMRAINRLRVARARTT